MSQESNKKLSREEIAAIEVGVTEIDPKTAWTMIVLFLVIIFSVPLLQLILDIKNPDQSPQVFEIKKLLPTSKEISSIKGFASGSTVNNRILREINSFEEDLENNSILQKTLLAPAQEFLSGVLKAGNEKAYCGKNGWLFYRPGIDHLTQKGFLDPKVMKSRAKSGGEWEETIQPDPVKAILHFKNQLSKRGIELILMPVPIKPSVHPEKFSSRFEGKTKILRNPSFEKFLNLLKRDGVKVFDTASAMEAIKKSQIAPLYLETDTHWNSNTMEKIALELSNYIKKLGVNLDKKFQEKLSRKEVSVSNLGDIATMLKLSEDQNIYSNQEIKVKSVSFSDGRPWESDDQSEILFLGDSFSNIFSLEGMNWGKAAGFVEQLSYELNRPVDKLSINDNGANASRGLLAQELMRGYDRLKGKKIVIWEFAERELSIGNWKLIEMILNLKAYEKRKLNTPKATGNLIIEAVIGEITKAPVPGQVPYKDALNSFSLNTIKVVTGDLKDQEILIYSWVMRENKLMPVAKFKKGQKIKVELIPWSKVQKKYGAYNRREVDDPMLMMLEVFWAEKLNLIKE
ncbi:MAG: hypothetical protein COA79_26210 [Planctomycetota bacterium]|nr:MAG: hypothetical protein COA79_26210 [Planctomycetota bacterium]